MIKMNASNINSGLHQPQKRNGISAITPKLHLVVVIVIIALFACNKPEEAYYRGIEGPTFTFTIPPSNAGLKITALDTAITLNKAEVLSFLKIEQEEDIRQFQFKYLTLVTSDLIPVSNIAVYVSSNGINKVKVAGWQGNQLDKTTYQLDINEEQNLLDFFNSNAPLNIKVDIMLAEPTMDAKQCELQSRFRFKISP